MSALCAVAPQALRACRCSLVVVLLFLPKISLHLSCLGLCAKDDHVQEKFKEVRRRVQEANLNGLNQSVPHQTRI